MDLNNINLEKIISSRKKYLRKCTDTLKEIFELEVKCAKNLEVQIEDQEPFKEVYEVFENAANELNSKPTVPNEKAVALQKKMNNLQKVLNQLAKEQQSAKISETL